MVQATAFWLLRSRIVPVRSASRCCGRRIGTLDYRTSLHIMGMIKYPRSCFYQSPFFPMSKKRLQRVIERLWVGSSGSRKTNLNPTVVVAGKLEEVDEVEEYVEMTRNDSNLKNG